MVHVAVMWWLLSCFMTGYGLLIPPMSSVVITALKRCNIEICHFHRNIKKEEWDSTGLDVKPIGIIPPGETISKKTI